MSNSNSTGWRYECKSCRYQMGIDSAFPEQCPGCHAGGWWGHLVVSAITQNGVKRVGTGIKNSEVTMSEGITTPKRFLSQRDNTVEGYEPQNKGIYEPSLGRGRGRPLQQVPGALIKELNSQGFSSRAMADELKQKGYKVGYKTIQRVLSRQR